MSVYVNVSWDVPNDVNSNPITNISYQVQYRLADAGGGNPGSWVAQTFDSPVTSGGRVSVNTGAVPLGQTLDVQVLSVGTVNTLSTGSSIVQVNTTAASVAPGSPTGLTASGSAGSAALSCTNPNSPNFSAVRFYRATAGTPFTGSTPVGTLLYGAANGTTTYTDLSLIHI